MMHSYITEGNFHDAPMPRRRYYNRRRKRPVRAYISYYYPIGTHYYVWMDVANNPIWDKNERAWCEYNDDPDLKWIWSKWRQTLGPSRVFSSQYMAKRYAERVFRALFDPKLFELEITLNGQYLQRDGD